MSLLLLAGFTGCTKPESKPRVIEGKTGLETNAAASVSEEVDSLNRKIDKLTDSIY